MPLHRKTAYLGLSALALAVATLPLVVPDWRDLSGGAPSPDGEVDISTTASVIGRASINAQKSDRLVGIGLLKAGLDALSDRDIARARAIRDSLPENSIDWRILAWATALGNYDEVPGSEIAATAAALADWPGMAALRENGERAMARELSDPRAAIEAFGEATPQTVEGIVLLARAHVELGQVEAARKLLGPFWRNEKLGAGDERRIIREFGSIIPASVHRHRMEQMLYEDRIASAERVAPLAGAEALAAAWAAVTRNQSSAGKLLDAVPADQRAAGYLFTQARYLRRSGKFLEAAELMLAAPRDRAQLIDADAWWVERRVLSRELLDIGKPDLAYRIAAQHSAESPASAADAEFHAGWYALRALDDAETAHRHFLRIAELTSGPISQARAYYWLARAAEAGGAGDAKSYYERAAANGAAFYGQLAAAELGRDDISAGHPEPSSADRAEFARRQAVAAIRRLEAAGHAWRADILYRDLAAELESPGELALLSAMAETRGNHHLALKIGKIAALRGVDIGALAHPVGAIPDSADISGAGKALAYAIARQESEFNVSAVSGAGARGLLQLLPGTAKDMAQQIGLAYSPTRLTTDAAYNATLGAAYLGEQLDRFDGSYVLTFAGYNAGPRRAQEWVDRYGDPRGKDVETVVDWIERIPYTETRNYVQRVMENFQVYKMRLTGSMDIASDIVK